MIVGEKEVISSLKHKNGHVQDDTYLFYFTAFNNTHEKKIKSAPDTRDT